MGILPFKTESEAIACVEKIQAKKFGHRTVHDYIIVEKDSGETTYAPYVEYEEIGR